MLGFEHASSRSVANLQHWVDGNWCLARDETAYLLQGRDLIGLGTLKDSAIEKLITWVEDRLTWLCKYLPMVQDLRKFPT